MRKFSSCVAAVAVATSIVMTPSAGAVELKIGPEYSPEQRAIILDNAQKIEQKAKERAAKQAAGELDFDVHSEFKPHTLLAFKASTVEELWECWKQQPPNRRNPFTYVPGGEQTHAALPQPIYCPLVPITEKDREAAQKKIVDGSLVQSSPSLVVSFVTFFWKVIEKIRAYFGKKN
ncbi:hypothetical protein P4N68_10205 [Corynebacterium felinum]|uniref:Uncharacterized protein n=2 Tax=Corynebacterium felinum TaxID=131318 RepID=A0ABU2B5A2_9CORY|nr:hypothetical protein [Corynebacterium felinum]MDF5821444.1 hypothetical protein [Corynebacterium felinum]MDR7353795.1 hypothetical protein [Corynebacterium felinum]WJY95974.1 hypothetical protein CFELI_11965 [Corynebacterium felinum]